MAGRAGVAVSRGAGGRGGYTWRDSAQRHEQIYSRAALDAASRQNLERTLAAARIPAGVFRDEFSLASFPERGQGQAGDVLYPGLQPGLDQPRRDELDRNAHG